VINLDYIRIIGDPVLREVCADVENFDGNLQNTISRMQTVLDSQEIGIALAANQIGITKQIFVYDLEDVEEGQDQGIIINPKIVESKGKTDYEEGCLSIPELYASIVRPKKITVQGQDIHGNEVILELDELPSRMFQHEIDHLNGITMVDRLEEDQKPEFITKLNAVLQRLNK
jgi:peptide deformylase